jgi:putative transposase
MTNHIHLVCIPAHPDLLSLVMKILDLRYAQHVNRTHGISGHLWQGRFFSCPPDEERLRAAIRYVGRNPVPASALDFDGAAHLTSDKRLLVKLNYQDKGSQ